MTTPNFVPQGAESLAQVRYFTPFDPYHYTTDNRPLQDLDQNVRTVATGGVDSARRAVLLAQLATSDVFRQLFRSPDNAFVMAGLDVEYFGTQFVRINPGAIYTSKEISTANPNRIVKQGLLVNPVNLTFVKPTESDSSVIYVVAGRYRDLDASSMSQPILPYGDPLNTFLPSLLMNGDLEVRMFAGTVAPSGTEVAPTVDTGWTPLYEVVSSYATASPVIRVSPSGPAIIGARFPVVLTEGGVAPAAALNLNGILTHHFPKSATSNLTLNASLRGERVNPYAPIKLRILYSATAVNGNFAMRTRFGAYPVGSVVTAAPGNISSIEVLPAEAGLVHELKAFNTSIMTIPTSAFAGFVSNGWAVNRDFLNLTLLRDVESGLDTNSGNLFIHEVMAYQ